MTSVLAILDVTYRVLVMVLGTMGNVTAIVLIPRNPRLRTWENAFHFMLCVVDLCNSVVSVPAGIAETVWSDHINPVFLCTQKRLYAYLVMVNLVILFDIAVLRCYRVRNETKVIPKILFIVGVIVQVSSPFLVMFASVFAQDKITANTCLYLYSPVNGTEVLNQQGGERFGVFVGLAIMVICCLKVLVSYVVLICHIRKVKRRVHAQPPSTDSTQHPVVSFVMATFGDTSRYDSELENMEAERRAIRYAHKISVNSGIVLAIFFCSFLPTGIFTVRMINYFNVAIVSEEIKSLLSAFASTSSYMNPYFYTLQNEALKADLKKLKYRLWLKFNM